MDTRIQNKTGHLIRVCSERLVVHTLKFLPLSFVLSLSLFSNSFNIQANADSQKVIAITEIVQHPSLEQARTGLLDELKENGYEEDKNLKVIQQNAQGSIANAVLIAKKFVSMKPDAIVPISTSSAQAVSNATKSDQVPIVFSSVTDPVAAGLVQCLSEPDPKITGAIDFPPLKEGLRLIKTIVPHIKTIGLLYSAGEANSLKTIESLKEEIKDQLKIIETTVPDSNRVGQALSALIGKVDAVYIPSDNTVFAAMPKVVKISRDHKLPIFSSDPDSVKQGVLACVGYTQYAVGRTAGKLLVKILKGEKNLKIEKPEHAEIFVNQISAEKMDIRVPETMSGDEIKIVK